jgi:hypothetical protein
MAAPKIKARTVQKGDWGKASPWGFDINIKVGTDIGGVFSAVWDTGDRFCKAYALLVQTKMQENVWPGRGPGPHPHPGREDSDWLRRSITTRRRKKGVIGPSPGWFAGAFSDRPVANPKGRAKPGAAKPWQYGFYLEFGWRARSGRRYRYPWAQPAFDWAAKKRIGKIAGASGLYITGR